MTYIVSLVNPVILSQTWLTVNYKLYGSKILKGNIKLAIK